jgi:hypothetical protein
VLDIPECRTVWVRRMRTKRKKELDQEENEEEESG